MKHIPQDKRKKDISAPVQHPDWCAYQYSADGSHGCYTFHYVGATLKVCSACHLFKRAYEVVVPVQLDMFKEVLR
jgi:hypothetical protein